MSRLTRLSTPDRDRDGAEWPHREHARLVDAAGMRWHVVVMGRGPVVLLLHGPGGASHTWAELAPHLGVSFTVVAPDLPGHGFTRAEEPASLAIESIAVGLGALVNALELRPALVISHSGSIGVAVAFAAAHEPAPLALIGIAPSLGVPPHMPLGSGRRLLGDLFGSRGAGVSDRFVARFLAALVRRPGMLERFLSTSGSQLMLSSIRCYRVLAAHAGHVAAGLAMVARTDRNAILEAVRALRAPMLLLAGQRDAWSSSGDCDELESASRRGLTVRLADAGHFPQEEQPATVARYIRELAGTLGVIR